MLKEFKATKIIIGGVVTALLALCLVLGVMLQSKAQDADHARAAHAQAVEQYTIEVNTMRESYSATATDAREQAEATLQVEQAANEESKAQIRQLKENSANTKVQVDTLQQQLTDVKQQVDKTTGQNNALHAQLDDTKTELTELQREYTAAQRTVQDLQTQLGQVRSSLTVSGGTVRQLEQRVSSLQTSLEQEQARSASRQTSLKQEQARSASLQTKYDTLNGQHEELLEAVDSLESLQTDITEAQEELEGLRASTVVTRGGFACTGSMEPKITCLDEATWWNTGFNDDDIHIGSVVSVRNEECWPEQDANVAHRVIDKVTREGVVSYRLQGDNASGFDDCWHSLANIHQVAVEIYTDQHPLNAPLRDKVNAAQAAYEQLRARYCRYNSGTGSFGCSPEGFEETLAAYWQDYCWTEAARQSRYFHGVGPTKPINMPSDCHKNGWTWTLS